MAGPFDGVVADLRFRSRTELSDKVSRVKTDQGKISVELLLKKLRLEDEFCREGKKEGRWDVC